MKARVLRMATLGLIVLFFGSSVKLLAQTEQEGTEKQKKQRENNYFNIPNLTDEQKEEIDKLQADYQKVFLSQRKQLEEKNTRLKSLITTEKADMEEINKVIEEIGEINVQVMKDQTVYKLAIRALLTAEQKVEFDKVITAGKKKKKRKGQGQRQDRPQNQN